MFEALELADLLAHCLGQTISSSKGMDKLLVLVLVVFCPILQAPFTCCAQTWGLLVCEKTVMQPDRHEAHEGKWARIPCERVSNLACKRSRRPTISRGNYKIINCLFMVQFARRLFAFAKVLGRAQRRRSEMGQLCYKLTPTRAKHFPVSK